MTRDGRPGYLDYVDPYEAAKVSKFMRPAEHGRWKIIRFDVDEAYVARQVQQAIFDDAATDERRREMSLRRIIPEGSYVALKRRATEAELADKPELYAQDDEHRGYVPVMSDTPAEIDGHAHAIEHAEGRVLVHGLGLGCLVSALLAKPEVDHIDVVEIDPDVIALTGPYYARDSRVTILRGDCLTFEWPSDARWDYVWHDIWSHISERNLNPDEAEHGITYQSMFDRFAERASDQGAWAYEEALEMRAISEAQREEMEDWNQRFFEADLDTQVEMVFTQQVRDHIRGPDGRLAFPEPEPIPQRIIDFFEQHTSPDGTSLRDQIREGIEEARRDGKLTREGFEKWRNKPEPIGNPNEFIVEADA